MRLIKVVWISTTDGADVEILKIHLNGENLAPEVDLASIAKRTELYSGSDLKSGYSYFIWQNIADEYVIPLDLCVAAALDSIKETVKLPWLTSTVMPVPPTSEAETSEPATESETSADTVSDDSPTPSARVLHPRHFDKAMMEITPSSSETLGTLSELRKWNDEFGEGRAKNKGKKSQWGAKFGFGGKDGKGFDGRVMQEELDK